MLITLIRLPDIVVGKLIFYRDSFFYFRQLISEFAERNSTTIRHMLGTKCNLKTHVRNLGYPLPLLIGAQKPPFGADFAT